MNRIVIVGIAVMAVIITIEITVDTLLRQRLQRRLAIITEANHTANFSSIRATSLIDNANHTTREHRVVAAAVTTIALVCAALGTAALNLLNSFL